MHVCHIIPPAARAYAHSTMSIYVYIYVCAYVCSVSLGFLSRLASLRLTMTVYSCMCRSREFFNSHEVVSTKIRLGERESFVSPGIVMRRLVC